MNKKTDPEVQKLYDNPDFIKIRILTSLLRDYGVKHVVLSPGGRDVPLVRMFEYNEDSFILHGVTDERSAAYYGLGIAAQLRSPVVCVCTSGTAASNYLPAVTEAYYTGIPMIIVTADRYEVFHEQGEDQTIPQRNIYRDVIKKEITLPEGCGDNVLRQVRRDISDCILETTHNGFGPVHINIAIGNISMGAGVDKKYWGLLPQTAPLIQRINLFELENRSHDLVEQLKASSRILVVYGQNPPLSPDQKEQIEMFASKYKCVFLTDPISNLDSRYSVGSYYNMLRTIDQKTFDEELAPNIIISVGGKRLMNDPLTTKIRNGSKSIKHWSVLPDGRVKDFYFRLSNILEMSQEAFFGWFGNRETNTANDGSYYEKWEGMSSKYSFPDIERFNANCIQSRFIPSIPAGSLLHLGVGQSFHDCRRYHINPDVEVYCNMGTNGIDGCTSTFMGQCAVTPDRLCFLLVGDLSFFYDMNSVWNKKLTGNIRIMMVNNNGTGLLRGHKLKYITSEHDSDARGWAETVGFKYISAYDEDEFDKQLSVFLADESEEAIFFEVFCWNAGHR